MATSQKKKKKSNLEGLMSKFWKSALQKSMATSSHPDKPNNSLRLSTFRDDRQSSFTSLARSNKGIF
jgi:hypothetical protein